MPSLITQRAVNGAVRLSRIAHEGARTTHATDWSRPCYVCGFVIFTLAAKSGLLSRNTETYEDGNNTYGDVRREDMTLPLHFYRYGVAAYFSYFRCTFTGALFKAVVLTSFPPVVEKCNDYSAWPSSSMSLTRPLGRSSCNSITAH